MIEPSGFNPETSNFMIKPVPTGWVVKFKENNRTIPRRFTIDYTGPHDPYGDGMLFYESEPALAGRWDISTPELAKRDAESHAMMLDRILAIRELPPVKPKNYSPPWLRGRGL